MVLPDCRANLTGIPISCTAGAAGGRLPRSTDVFLSFFPSPACHGCQPNSDQLRLTPVLRLVNTLLLSGWVTDGTSTTGLLRVVLVAASHHCSLPVPVHLGRTDSVFLHASIPGAFSGWQRHSLRWAMRPHQDCFHLLNAVLGVALLSPAPHAEGRVLCVVPHCLSALTLSRLLVAGCQEALSSVQHHHVSWRPSAHLLMKDPAGGRDPATRLSSSHQGGEERRQQQQQQKKTF